MKVRSNSLTEEDAEKNQAIFCELAAQKKQKTKVRPDDWPRGEKIIIAA